ncbi:hypothetical protein UCDDA912_g00041 [Diaporthe ampelina]|uniref:Uncharacterized protein n=1 Tax=Diaporthe ampelina TaxID=1214573 RepID=A0A0G2HZ43_9PEZI|nr:hypothetical protein UCDDA912_g00041 [Diaporthe ampelina]
MSETITKFLQLAQERALDDKIISLQETIASLHDRTNKAEARISQVEADKTQLQNRIDEAEALISQAKADNTKLQDEIVELRAQLSHTVESFMKAASRARYEEEQLRRPHEPQRNATQLRGPPRQPLNDESFEDTDDQQLLPQQEIEVMASQKADNLRGCEENPRKHRMKRSDRTHAHDDEVPRRGEKKQPHVGDRSTDRRKEFVAYYHSMRREYDEGKHGKNQRAFICRFIDGIGDPDFSHWLQECLKAQYPDKVHDAKRPPKAGGRTVALSRDLTWEEVKTLIKYTPHPSFTD